LYDTLAFEIYQEIHHQIQNNVTSVNDEFLFSGMTPPTTVRDSGEDGDTGNFFQQQGTVAIGVLDTP